MKDGEVVFKFEEHLSCTGPRPQKDLDNFRKMVEYWALLLDDDDKLMVQKMNEDDEAEETAELLKDLFPVFSYVKRKRKPKKD